jgi:hypothetical protein
MIGHAPYGADRPIAYRLKVGRNGGADPHASHPGSWSPPDDQGLPWSASGAWTCDCAGFVAWSLGFDRYQPRDFAAEGDGYDYINTDSMIMASRSSRRSWFLQIDRPEPGCLAVYGSTWKDGRRATVGHVGFVVEVLAAEWDFETPPLDMVRVVHCSSGNQRRTGAAIQETDATIWRRPGSLWLRYLRAI